MRIENCQTVKTDFKNCNQGIRSPPPSELCLLNISSIIRLFNLLLPQVTQMLQMFPLDVSGNLDYKNLCYVITHGEDKEQE